MMWLVVFIASTDMHNITFSLGFIALPANTGVAFQHMSQVLCMELSHWTPDVKSSITQPFQHLD